MANIIEEFLNAREFEYSKTVRNEYDEKTSVRMHIEKYTLNGEETLDGLKLMIIVNTGYLGNVPMSQDFVICSNRGITRWGTVANVFEMLRNFL